MCLNAICDVFECFWCYCLFGWEWPVGAAMGSYIIQQQKNIKLLEHKDFLAANRVEEAQNIMKELP